MRCRPRRCQRVNRADAPCVNRSTMAAGARPLDETNSCRKFVTIFLLRTSRLRSARCWVLPVGRTGPPPGNDRREAISGDEDPSGEREARRPDLSSVGQGSVEEAREGNARERSPTKDPLGCEAARHVMDIGHCRSSLAKVRGALYSRAFGNGQRRSIAGLCIFGVCCRSATANDGGYFLRKASSATTSAPLRSSSVAGAGSTAGSLCFVALAAGVLA